MTEQTRSVKSIETMSQIVDALVEHDGARVTVLSDELGLAKSTVHQQLTTLCSLGYAVKENSEYHVGLKFFSIGEHARRRQTSAQVAKPMVEQLAAETEERAQYFLEEHGQAVYVHIDEGKHGVKAGRHPGTTRHLHSSAGGKAILSQMPHDRVLEVINRWGLPTETDHTITDKSALFAELEQIRKQGYATNEEESIGGLWALGVPVVANGEVVGAFSVSGPRHRLNTDRFRTDLPDTLRGVANELELKLEYL